MPHNNPRPVGILDSGFGGLSVMRALRDALPSESLVFAADNAGAPWGDKPLAYIRRRCFALVDALVAMNVKALVVACNTATAVCIDEMRRRWNMPIVGIEPAVRPAAALTQSGVIAVLATRATLHSPRYLELKRRFAGHVTVLDTPGTGLVECVESGDLSGEAARRAVTEALAPALARRADTIVLGCTHYPFLTPLMKAVAGPGVRFIDPAPAVAKELARRLAALGIDAPNGHAPQYAYHSTGPDATRSAVIARLAGPQARLAALSIAET